MSATRNKFSPGFRDRTVRMVKEHRGDYQPPKWQSCAGSTDSTITACSRPSGIYRPPRLKRRTMQPERPSVWLHDSSETASGKPGTLHHSEYPDGRQEITSRSHQSQIGFECFADLDNRTLG